MSTVAGSEIALTCYCIFSFSINHFALERDGRNYWRCSVRKGVFRNFAKFTGKHLCQSLFFNKKRLGLTFIGHHRVPLRNWKFVKPQIFLNLNLSLSKCFLESFIKRAQILSKESFWPEKDRNTPVFWGRMTNDIEQKRT